MNQNSSGSITLQQAISGFLQAKEAEALRPRTIESYRHELERWAQQLGTPLASQVTAQDVRAYLVYLRTDYKPRRFNGQTNPLSPKTLRNAYITLASYFHWLNVEFGIANPMTQIPAPKYQVVETEPFTQREVETLLQACQFKREAETRDRCRFVQHRPTALRDRAIVLVLLDTGLRASELCALDLGDLDQRTGKVVVKAGDEGGAKGGKGRLVYLGKAARRAVWRYVVTREDGNDPLAPLFTVRFGRRMNKNALLQLIQGLGAAAQVKDCYPHRFRHTFAITYLRSGGDIFTLQKLLGHSSLDMVKHYAKVAQIDVEQAHRRASPADNWRL